MSHFLKIYLKQSFSTLAKLTFLPAEHLVVGSVLCRLEHLAVSQ